MSVTATPSDVYVHQSRIDCMPGFVGEGFSWHSDFETWHAEDGLPAPRAVSVSLALRDNLPYNGGLMLIPGSHRTFVPCTGETPADHHRNSLREQEIGVPAQADIARLAAAHGIDQFTGPAGSALWFDANVLHGSGNNITPYPRSNGTSPRCAGPGTDDAGVSRAAPWSPGRGGAAGR